MPTVMVLFWTTKPLALMSSTGITAEEYESKRDCREYQSDSKLPLRPADSQMSPVAMMRAPLPMTMSLAGRRSTVVVPTTTPTPPFASALASRSMSAPPRADMTTRPGEVICAPASTSTLATSVCALSAVFTDTPAPRPAASKATFSKASMRLRAAKTAVASLLAWPTMLIFGAASTAESRLPTSTRVFSVSVLVLLAEAPETRALAEPSRLASPRSARRTLLSAVAETERAFTVTPSAKREVTVELMVWVASAPAPEMKPAALARSSELKAAACVADRLTEPSLPR